MILYNVFFPLSVFESPLSLILFRFVAVFLASGCCVFSFPFSFYMLMYFLLLMNPVLLLL